jgi:Ring finger domain
MGLFHILLISLDVLLVTLDTVKNYESLEILLCYEYILMGLFAFKSFAVFLLQMFEKIFREGGWEGKAGFLSALEFIYNFSTLGVIVVEFMILSKRSAIGIYFIDKSLRAVTNMWKYFSGYLESRKLLSKVNNFPDATIEEIHKANDKCIFCLDHLASAKRINCGHLFHYKCLRSYFENSSSPKCPTCRADIDDKFVLHHSRHESLSQNVASSFLLQDLPNSVNSIGNPLEIGPLPWGLPQAVTSDKISKHHEKMRHAVENMNEFIIRFYKHPPDQEEISPDDNIKEDHYKHLKENFLKMFESK